MLRKLHVPAHGEVVSAPASLQRVRLRSTVHRLAVLRMFQDEPARRFTVEGMAEQLLKQGEWIAIASLYNTIRRLVAEDLVDRSWLDGGRSLFWLKQDVSQPAAQIACRCCQRSLVPHDTALEQLAMRLCAAHGFALGAPSVLIQVVCADCRSSDRSRRSTPF